MYYFICLLLLLLFRSVSTDDSAPFCLCALKNVLKDYTLLATDRRPPRYRSAFANDIGFYVVPSNWKPVNNATWVELGLMINAPDGMYTHISIDGINPVNSGLLLNGLRSSHLADIMTEYRLMMSKVNIYYENIIQNRTETCLAETKKSVVGSDLNQWQKFFIPRSS